MTVTVIEFYCNMSSLHAGFWMMVTVSEIRRDIVASSSWPTVTSALRERSCPFSRAAGPGGRGEPGASLSQSEADS